MTLKKLTTNLTACSRDNKKLLNVCRCYCKTLTQFYKIDACGYLFHYENPFISRFFIVHPDRKRVITDIKNVIIPWSHFTESISYPGLIQAPITNQAVLDLFGAAYNSMITIPVVYNGAAIATLLLVDRGPGLFGSVHPDEVKMAGSLMAEYIKKYTSFQEDSAVKRIIATTTDLISQNNTGPDVNFCRIVEALAGRFQFNRVVITKYGPGEKFNWYAAHIDPEGNIDKTECGINREDPLEIVTKLPPSITPHYLSEEITRGHSPVGHILLDFNHPISAFYNNIHNVITILGPELLAYL